jgi:hypothetical protein
MELKGYTLTCCDNWFPYIKYEYKPIKYLEIGALSGVNVVHVSKTYCMHPDSKIYVIDPWIDYDDYTDYKGEHDTIYNDFISNIEKNSIKDKVIMKRGFSYDMLQTLEDNFFDIIYIDGNHAAEYVLEDAVLSFRKLKNGGMLVFDDYQCNDVKKSVHAFIECYNSKIDSNASMSKNQVFIKKL